MARQIRLYDLPDEHRSVREWLDELSNDDFLAHIFVVEKLGPAFAGCRLLPDDMWALTLPIGYGKTANLIFFSLKSGDYLAVHGYTLKPGQSDTDDVEIARQRKRSLI